MNPFQFAFTEHIAIFLNYIYLHLLLKLKKLLKAVENVCTIYISWF